MTCRVTSTPGSGKGQYTSITEQKSGEVLAERTTPLSEWNIGYGMPRKGGPFGMSHV